MITSLRKQRNNAREFIVQLQIQINELQQTNKEFIVQVKKFIIFFIKIEIDEKKNEKKKYEKYEKNNEQKYDRVDDDQIFSHFIF